MFKTYEFIYNEIPSSMYGLFICDFDGNNNESVPFGNKADIIERHVNNRIRPLHYGVDYNKEPLSFKLVFASYNELDRWEMQEVANWLTGYHDYKWLQIEQCDMDDLSYRCLITELSPIHAGWAPYAFEAIVRCDCPYAYGPEFSENINVAAGYNLVNLFNEGTAKVPCKPTLRIIPDQSGTVKISNTYADGDLLLEIKNIPASVNEIFVDNENAIITANDKTIDLYGGFNDNFFKLFPGDNAVEFAGINNVYIEGRFYYNVGA